MPLEGGDQGEQAAVADPSTESPRVKRSRDLRSRARIDDESASKPASGFRSIRVDPTKVKIPPKAQTKRYWVGVFVNAPFESRSCYGVTFQKWTGVIEADPATGKLILDRANRGAIVDLADEQVYGSPGDRTNGSDGKPGYWAEGVQRAVARKIVRTVGTKEDATGNFRCDTYDVTSPSFRPGERDEPLGKYLYCIEVDEVMPPNWRSLQPPSMVDG